MEYTIGELIDKLIVVHLKLWHLEENMNDNSISLEDKGDISKQIIKLNTFRSKIVNELDKIIK